MAGRRFELLTVRQTWGEYRVYFYDEDGRLIALPVGWTDAGDVDPFIEQAAGRALFKPVDLLALAALIQTLSDTANTEQGGEN